jgi:hypothetical protein
MYHVEVQCAEHQNVEIHFVDFKMFDITDFLTYQNVAITLHLRWAP